MAKFKAGDRVSMSAIPCSTIPSGAQGTILQDYSYCPYVGWDIPRVDGTYSKDEYPGY